MKKDKISLLILLGFLFIFVGVVLSGNELMKNEEETGYNNVSSSNVYSQYKLELDENYIENISEKINIASDKLSKAMNFPDPEKAFFKKTVNGKEYYVLKSIDKTSGMAHQQTYSSTGKTNCLCYAYAYVETMINGYTNSAYAQREKCDYPGEFGLETEKTDTNVQKAFEEIMSGRPVVMHGLNCGRAGTHYFVIVGFTTDSYDKYMLNGKVNSSIYKAKWDEIASSLLVYDPWYVNQDQAYYNLREARLSGDSCVWDIDLFIGYLKQ